MFAVPVHPIGAYSQVNMQTDAYNHLFIWLSQIEAELQALWTWFQNMENRPIVQVGMQTLQDLEARVDRLEALTRSTEVLQQILQRLDLILDLVQNLDSNALGWPPLRCQPNSGPTSGSANRLHEEANNPEKMDQLFSSPNGTDSNKSTVTVTGRQERDVATMEEFEDHELLANGSESLLASSQARLDPTKPPFEPSTAKKPTKEHGPDQSYRPSDPLARLEALGHSLDQSMHAPKSLVSNSSASHAARMSNDALEDEPRSSFLERLQQRGIKFSQPQQISPPRDIGGDEDNAPRNSEQSPQSPKPEERGTKFSRPQQIVLSRDTGCDEDNALRNSGQNLQSPTPYERELSSDASRGKDHDKSLSIRNIKLAKQVLAGSLMEENNPPGASKVQEPLKAEAAHLSNKIHPASHQSTSESPSTVLKMISSDFYMRYQNSNAMKSPRKHELSSTQVGSRSHPASAIIEDTSVPDVKDPLILEKPGDKDDTEEVHRPSDNEASFFSFLNSPIPSPPHSATPTLDPFEQQPNSFQATINPPSRPGTNQSSPQRLVPDQAIPGATALSALMNEGFKNFLQKADYRGADPRKNMMAQITASTDKRRQEIARIFAEDGQFISSTGPPPKHPRIAGELLDETVKVMVMRPPTFIPAKRPGWDWLPAAKQDGTRFYRLSSLK